MERTGRVVMAEARAAEFKEALALKQATSAIQHGAIVALHNKFHNRFMRLYSGTVDSRGGQKNYDELPLSWSHECFMAVAVGEEPSSKFALYSLADERYVRVSTETCDVIAGPIKELGAPIDEEETFDVVEVSKDFKAETVAFRSCKTDKFIRMNVEDVDAEASEVNKWEHYRVIELQGVTTMATAEWSTNENSDLGTVISKPL